MSDGVDFERDISALCDRAGANARAFVVALTLAIQAYIQDRLPVVTGRLRASVQPLQPLSAWQPGETITLASGLEYTRRIEYGFTGTDSSGRHYNEPGVGAFTAAANAFDQIADETARRLGIGNDGSLGQELSGVEDIVAETYDTATGGALSAAMQSMGTVLSGVEAFEESMASIAEAAAEFGVIL